MADFWDLVPEALCVLGAGNRVLHANAKFSKSIGQHQRLAELDFVQNIVGIEDRKRFLIALDRVRGVSKEEGASPDASEDSSSDMDVWLATPVVRDCDTLALGSSLDFPIWRRYDWAMSMGSDGSVIVSGRMTTVVSEEKKASEKELMDFLNKAPIAMHWLSGTGHVLWANETELNTLGYTAEEYIGQPIMKFCPDEEELVLEIFKTLGSGNTIKDVPVRFRTKDGQIRDLLIDSNVNWNADGSFKHTRCFIRDDTARKVREARMEVLKEQDAQMAAAKDAFVRKIFHEIKTPCHIITNCFSDLEDSMLKSGRLDGDASSVLVDLKAQARRLTCLVDDAADAVIFDSGKVPKFKNKVFDLHKFILSTVIEVETVYSHNTKVDHYLAIGSNPPVYFYQAEEELQNSSLPKYVKGDSQYLRRAIVHVLENAIKFCYNGSVTLAIDCSPGADKNDDPLFFFTVTDTGPGMNPDQVNKAFNRYWQHVDPSQISDGSNSNCNSFDAPSCGASFDAPTPTSPQRPAKDLGFAPRSKSSSMEMDLSEKRKSQSFQQVEGLGLGLNIVNNIVQSMGGQLDFTSQPGETVFCISVCLASPNANEIASANANELASFSSLDFAKSIELLSPMTSDGQNPKNVSCMSSTQCSGKATPNAGPGNFSRLRSYTMSQSEWVNVEDSQAANTHFVTSSPLLSCNKAIAVGLAQMSASQPHCLVVDDNSVCQKVAKRMVVKVGCTCDTAGNGQEAVDMVSANPYLYDIVFMDLRMPVMDGIDATTMIKQKLGLSVPIVAFSAEVGEETRQICEEAGFDGFMAKPAGRDIVEMYINKLVKNRIHVDPPACKV